MPSGSLIAEADAQLPQGQQVFLDHVGHFVRDREAARAALVRAGFAPTPISIQENADPGGKLRPTGTGNVTAMLRRGYIEVLFKTADTPLGLELDAAMARHAGVHLAAFSVADAAQVHGRLARDGFRVRPLAALQRPVATESGEASAAFTVTRVEPGEMPEGRIQFLTHRTEDAVWQQRWLTHPNTALGLQGLLIAVADPDAASERFARFTGKSAHANRFGRVLQLDRGHLQFVTADCFAELIPGVPLPSMPFMGTYGIAVRSLATLAGRLRETGIQAKDERRAVIASFPEPLGQGAWVFVEAGADLPWNSTE
ncbi:MAG: VOC family protein [Xanthobacteraceae bacterium]